MMRSRGDERREAEGGRRVDVDVDVAAVGRVGLDAAAGGGFAAPPQPRSILSAFASPPSPFFAPMRGRFAQSWASRMRCLRQ